MNAYAGRVGFAIGTGRCGTLFFYQLLAKEPGVASSHERNPENEAFLRYCTWHGLPVDQAGFLAAKEREIVSDLEQRSLSFEASPYLSLSVRALHERFGARFVALVRRPDGVVTSFVHKGFYREAYVVADPDLAAGYQDCGHERMFTYFARVSPRGAFLDVWNRMSQVGRVAWFWRAMNERMLSALEAIPPESYRIVRIEDVDYATYLELSEFLGCRATVTQADFELLRTSKPHAFWRKRRVDQWTEQEAGEFEGQVRELAERFGYEHRVDRLREQARAERDLAADLGHLPAPRRPARFWRVRRATANVLRGIAKSMDVG